MPYLRGGISNHNRLIMSSFENFFLFLKFTKEVIYITCSDHNYLSDLTVIQKSLETGW